jgi:hypothetical protein
VKVFHDFGVAVVGRVWARLMAKSDKAGSLEKKKKKKERAAMSSRQCAGATWLHGHCLAWWHGLAAGKGVGQAGGE